MVPFKAIFEFLRSLDTSLDALGLAMITGVSENSINNYSRGSREGKPSFPSREDVLEKLFEGMCSEELYYVTPLDYKEKAKRLIKHLVSTRQINEGFLDINGYLGRIDAEAVPEDEEAFRSFLHTCVFHEFFVTYLRLWRIADYRNAKPIVRAERQRLNPLLVYEDNYKEYMPQRLTAPESGETLFALDLEGPECDWDFFVRHPLTLVTGPGGQGKTYFLHALARKHTASPGIFEKIYIVPLINLTELDINEVNVNVNLIERYISGCYANEDIASSAARSLVLIDGYNEFRASPNHALTEKIGNSLTSFIRRILNRDLPNVSIVLTSREAAPTLGSLPFRHEDFLTAGLSGTSDTVYSEIKSRYGQYGFPFEGTEVEKLAGIPLYAKMLKELQSKRDFERIQDKYALFDAVYRLRANQRLGSESHKNAYDKATYLYFYYVILPAFAYELNVSGKYTGYYFRSIEIRQLLDTAKKDGLDAHLYAYFRDLNQFGEISALVPEIDAPKLEDFLKNEESVIIKKDYRPNVIVFQFEHQEWRDYLVAKYLRSNVDLLRSNHNSDMVDVIKSYRVNCNVDSNVARMVLQSFDMASSPEENGKRAKEFFQVDCHFSRRRFGKVRLLHAAFDFNEYLQLELPVGENRQNKLLHEIFSDLTNYLLNNMREPVLPDDPGQKELEKYRRRLAARQNFRDSITADPELVHDLCEILSKETEYYRRRYNYAKVMDILKVAQSFCEDSDIICQQAAKLYLCAFEERFTPRFKSIDPEERCRELDEMKAEELFLTGMDQLKIVAGKGFHLSANTIGVFLSNPAPLLIRRVESLKPDFCGAFRYYMNVIYAAHYTKRDIAYTVRQALGLLLKGYIRIAEDNMFEPEDETCDLCRLEIENNEPLFSQDMDSRNAEFAFQLMRSAEGQSLAGLNYLRGCAAYAKGFADEAEMYWKLPMKNETKLLYHIARKYRLREEGLDREIDEGFEAAARKIEPAGNGQVDRTHPAYWYIEAKETELALLTGEEKENRKKYFRELEQKHKANEILRVIYGFLFQDGR